MKKFIIMMTAALMIFGVQSCKEKPKFAWEGNVECQADGLVEGTFPTGTFEFDGNGGTVIRTASQNAFEVFGCDLSNALDLESSMASNDTNLASAATTVNSFFTITKAEGKYHVRFNGFVSYGPFLFRVDEEYPKDSTVVSVNVPIDSLVVNPVDTAATSE